MEDRFSRVLVYARVCPCSSPTDGSLSVVASEDGTAGAALHKSIAVTLTQASTASSGVASRAVSRTYSFERVFPPDATQADVCAAVGERLVDDVLASWNAAVLAYGQTGSGKTWTMTGPRLAFQDTPTTELSAASVTDVQASDGILPRLLAQLFDRARSEATSASVDVDIAYVQLYCEAVQDLLAPPEAVADGAAMSLAIREDPREGVYVQGLTWVPVSDLTAAVDVVLRGNAQRAVASTRMNAFSSRSHAVAMVRVTRRTMLASSGDALASPARGAQLVQRGTLYLVDLAGSERAVKSGATSGSTLMNEMKAINLSLSALGNVIAALAESARGARGGRRHIPYRDSKLTRLLQDCLGGNARTSMIITVSQDPSCLQESVNTLDFGSRASRVAVHPHRNQKVDYRALYLALKARLGAPESAGEAQVQEAEDEPTDTSELEAELERLRTENARLKDEVEELRRRLEEAAADAAAMTTPTAVAADGRTGAMSRPASSELVPAEVPSAPAVPTSTPLIMAVRREAEQRVAAARAVAEAAERARDEARNELLETLKQYRLARERVREVERDTIASLADAVLEVEAARVREEQATRERDELRAALQQASARLDALGKGEASTPSEAALAELHGLYASTIELLQQRVEQLERSRGVPSTQRLDYSLEAQLHAAALDTLKDVPDGLLAPGRAAAAQPPSRQAAGSAVHAVVALQRGGAVPGPPPSGAATNMIAGLHLPSLHGLDGGHDGGSARGAAARSGTSASAAPREATKRGPAVRAGAPRGLAGGLSGRKP